MFGLSTFSVGVAAILLSLGVWALSHWAANWVAHRRPPPEPASPLPLEQPLSETGEALIVAQPGGRVLFVNDLAREWFGLDGTTPHLEALARRVNPAAVFYSLFAAEGSARLTLAGRTVEAASHALPADHASSPRLLVVLRETARLPGLRHEGAQSGETVRAISELSQAMAASLDLQATLDAVLQNVRRVIPNDRARVTLWDEDRGRLATGRLLEGSGSAETTFAIASTGSGGATPGDEPSEQLARQRKPILKTSERPAVSRFQSFAGVPLLFGDRLVGTLELFAEPESAFDEHDLRLLETVAGQASTAIHNAQLFAAERQRVTELSSLTRIWQAVGSLSDTRDLFHRMTAEIASLMDVEVLGILLYDDTDSTLAGQTPFHGLPDQIVELYRIPLPEDSAAQRWWREVEQWISNRVLEEPFIAELQLAPLAQAAGIRSILFVPIMSRGRRLGLVQAANKRAAGGFDDADARRLAVLAGQAAVVIDNARLVRETRERAERSEGLRRIADIVASSAGVDETLSAALEALAQLVGAERAAVLLFDETRGEIRPHVPSAVGGRTVEDQQVATLHADDPAFRFSVTQTRRPFMTNRAQTDRRVLKFYRPLVEAFRLRSVIDVPLVSQNRGIGELMLGKREGRPFGRADLELTLTVAGQLAGAIERARLYSATDEGLRRRVEQLTSLARVGRELNQTLELERVMRLIFDEALHTAHADRGRLVIFDLAAMDAAPQPMLHIGEGDPSDGLSAIDDEVIRTARPARIADLASGRVEPPLPGVRSALVVPVSYQGGVVGLIQLYANESDRFDSASEEIAVALAAQATLAVGNSIRFQEQVRRGDLLRRRTDALTQLFQISRTVRSDRPLAANLETIALGAQEATGHNVVLMSVVDPETGRVQPAAGVGLPLSRMEKLRALRLPWESIEGLFRPEFRISQAYLIPAGQVPDSVRALDPIASETRDEPDASATPVPGDMFVLPLYGLGGKAVGVMSVDDPRAGLAGKSDRSTVETLEIFANQAALAIENARLVASYESRAEELSRSLASLKESYRALDEASASLVRKDLQLSQAVDELDQRTEHLLAIHRIAEALADQRHPDPILRQFAELTLREMGLTVCLIGVIEHGRLRLPVTAGAVPPQVNLESLLGQRNPLRQVSTAPGAPPILERDVLAGPWKESALLNALEVRSFVCLPLTVSGQLFGAVLIGSETAGTPFHSGDLDLFAVLAAQLSTTLERAQLFGETERRLREVNLLLEFSQQINGLDGERVAEGLVNTVAQVIANADAVAHFAFEPKSGTICAVAGRGYDNPAALRAIRLAPEQKETIAGKGFASVKPLRWAKVDAGQDLNLGPENLARYREATAGRLPASALAVPLTGSDRQLGVLVLENFARTDAFGSDDEAMASSLASQAAVAIHNAALYRETLDLTAFNEAVFESIQQGIAVLDTEGRVLHINDFIRATYGWDETFIGKNIFEHRPVFRQIGLEAGFRHILDTGGPMEKFRVTHPDREGNVLVRNFYGYPLRQSGQVGGVVVLVEDVTERAKLEEDVRERAAQLEALTNVSRAITSSLRREDIIDSLLTELKQILSYTSATLWLREGERLRVVAAQGYENDSERLGLRAEIADSALFTEMLLTRSVSYVPDVRDDARFTLAAESPVRSWLGVPLIIQGEVVGAFAIEAAQAEAYRPQHLQTAATFAGQAAVALENARLYEESVGRAAELDTRSRRLALLNRMSSALASTLQVERVLEMTLVELARALNVEQAGAVLFDERAGVGRLLAEFPTGRPPTGIEIPLAGNPVIERVQQTLAPLEVLDVADDELMAPVRETLLARGVRSILIIPLVIGGRVVGTLGLDSLGTPRHFGAGEVELAQTFANQAAVAVQNAQLYNESQLRLVELATINQISRAISSAIDTAGIVDVLQAQLSAVLHTENYYLALFDPGANRVSFPIVVERGERLELPMGPPAGLTGHVLKTRASLFLAGPEMSRRLAELGARQYGEGGARSYLGVPLMLADQAVGVLAVQDLDRGDAFNEGHERVLSTIAAQVAVAIDNARLYEETRALTRDLERRVAERTADLERERDRVEALLRVTSELSTSLDLDRVLSRALTLVSGAVGADQGAIFLIDPQSDGLIYRAALNREPPLPPGGQPAPFKQNEGLVGWAIKHRKPAVIDDLRADPRWIERPERPSRNDSAIAVPLVASEDVLGALLLFGHRRHAFNADLMKLAAAAANQVATAINNAELYRLIRDQAERLGGMLRAQQVEASKSRAILEAVADGVMVADAGGRVILFNAAAERILRLSRAEVLGRPVSELVGIYGAASRSWSDAIHRWADDPGSHRPGDFLAERLTLDDKRVVSVHLAPVTTADELLGSVSVFRDITREVEVDRLKSEFVATVSHELRTPMTSIKGYADLLLMGAAGSMTADQARFLEVIRNNADRLSVLVNDLLDISRIESGKVSLTLVDLDLVEIAGEALDHLRGRMHDEHKPMDLTTDFAPGLPPVVGDRDRVRQILTNLVDNAFLYTPEGGRIAIRISPMPGGVQVDVSDNGIGIPAEEQTRVFDRFYRGEDPLVLASAGTGLGLSIVRHLVEMHGGYIWVQSAGVPGKGSTFSVLLPLTQEPAQRV